MALDRLASWHPVDHSYIGEPYLDKGLGGIGPGVSASVSVVAPSGPTIALEFSTAAIEVRQSGRLVSGTATGRLRDSVVSLLAGFTARPSSRSEIALLAGVGLAIGGVSQGGVAIDAADDPAVREGDGPIGFIAGVCVGRAITRRMRMVGSARYVVLPRSRRAEELGVSHHIVRVGAGIELRLSK